MAGKVYKYGDSVDTDVILPARYLVGRRSGERIVTLPEGLGPPVQSRRDTGSVRGAPGQEGQGQGTEHHNTSHFNLLSRRQTRMASAMQIIRAAQWTSR